MTAKEYFEVYSRENHLESGDFGYYDDYFISKDEILTMLGQFSDTQNSELIKERDELLSALSGVLTDVNYDDMNIQLRRKCEGLITKLKSDEEI